MHPPGDLRVILRTKRKYVGVKQLAKTDIDHTHHSHMLRVSLRICVSVVWYMTDCTLKTSATNLR